MKLYFTLLLSLLFFSSSIAQYSLDPEVILIESNGEDVEVKVDITNNTGEFANIYWMYEKGVEYPKEWETTICDDTLCYAKNKFKSSPNLPNPMLPEYSFFFKITIEANDEPGSSYAILHVYDDKECENEVATSNPPSLSIKEKTLEALSVFPNPTQDFFSIRNDRNIKSLDVINNVGQILISAPHANNEMHSIANLPNGNFIVVLKDSENNIVKSLYLTKE